jgi:hypothetical protein
MATNLFLLSNEQLIDRIVELTMDYAYADGDVEECDEYWRIREELLGRMKNED